MQQILNINCLDWMKDQSANSVQMTLTDIPYNEVNKKAINQGGLRQLDKGQADILEFDLPTFLQEAIRITKGSIYIFCGITQVSLINQTFRDAGLSDRLLIWEKTNPSPMNSQYIWLSGIECCVFGKKPGATFNGRYEHNVIKMKTTRSKIHPTQKPVELFEKLIAMSSNANDIIYDPCAGSGTTGVAAKNLNRSFILNEIDEVYYKASKERLGL